MHATDYGTHPDIVLEFRQVFFSYNGNPVLEDISFHLHTGEFAALIGQNGSGKTTALKLSLGLETPQAGQVLLFGEDPQRYRSRVGYVPQYATADDSFPISVREVVEMGRAHPVSRRFTQADREATEKAMEKALITDLANRPYAALSGGQRRRVLVARALASDPDLLILDEPTANMDSQSEERLFATLEILKGSTTVLIVTHDTAFVSSLTDTVLCLGDRAADGRKRGIVRHETIPATNAPPLLYGGKAAQVLHESTIQSHCGCCGEDEK